MRPIHRLAVAALVASALVSGCSADEPADDPTQSSAEASASETSDPSGTAEPTDPTGTPEPTETAETQSGVATGELAEGFPADVVPVPPDATITLSSVVPGEGARTLSLSGTTPLPADQILELYRTSLVGQGFVESTAAQPEGFPTATFSRSNGADLLVVAVSTVGGLQTFTVGGTLAG